MKIDFTDKARVDALRSILTKSEEIQNFEAFLSEVQVFDFDNDEHVQMAKGSCCHCCGYTVSGPIILEF